MNIPRRLLIPHGRYDLTVRTLRAARKNQNEFVRLRQGMLRLTKRRAWEWSSQHDTFRFRRKAEAMDAYQRLKAWSMRHRGYIREIDLAWAPLKTCPCPMGRGPGRKMIGAHMPEVRFSSNITRFVLRFRPGLRRAA